MTDDEANTTDDATRLLDALAEVGVERLTELAEEGTVALETRMQDSVDGPDGETRYHLFEDRLPTDRYHESARVVTKAVLEASPREPAEIDVTGVAAFLRRRDEAAVETLLENGVSYVETEYNDGTLEGRCEATPRVVAAVLSLYGSGLIHAHVLDDEGDAITARFDDTLQYYWLPEGTREEVRARLDPTLSSAIVTDEEVEQIADED